MDLSSSKGNLTMSKKTSRRSFIKGAGAASGALISAPYIIPASAFGANERIVMGIIGPGAAAT